MKLFFYVISDLSCSNATILKSFRIFVIIGILDHIIGDVMNTLTAIHVTIRAK